MKTLRWLQPTFNTLLGVVLTLGMLFIYGKVSAHSPSPRPRFEKLLWEKGGEGDKEHIRDFEVWHDKESGIEFICAYPYSTISSTDKITCFSTGRGWLN